ncbi:MAG: glycosyltransferase [Proteobacteria bacterium]|nr:glycosyltransferase [Pseudomonadota bacterium]MBS0574733.1 glycosyltransferase [Pseudomonadota bacterium]
MRILFVHQNFPGQFVHLAPALAARGHRVVALADVTNKRPQRVETWYYRKPETGRLRGVGATFADAAARGEMVAGAASQLRDRQGFVPDVIFGHNGWGEMLFLREVWPGARILNYAEFVYRARGLDADFDPEFQSGDAKAAIATAARAAHILQSMIGADAALAPTGWQADTFPAELRAKITVLHDGVDTDEVRPDPGARFGIPGTGLILRPGDEVLTFVNRNLEPYRGYHILMRALPEVLRARPAAQVVIVGGDGQSYGRPPAGGSWKDIFLNEVRDRLDLSRVHFTGRLERRQFVALMQVARVHAYLTYPFVLSWSMIEAMAAGALVVGSRTGPVAEVLRDGENGRLVDFFDVAGWSAALTQALADPGRDDPLRAAARATVLKHYDLRRRCLPGLIGFVEGGGPPPSDRGAVAGR